MLTFSPRNTARIMAFFGWINRPSVVALFAVSSAAFGLGCYMLGWTWAALSFGASAAVDSIRLLRLRGRSRGHRRY